MQLRTATSADLEAIREIYNYEVRHGVATLDTEGWSEDALRTSFAGRDLQSRPMIVATEGDTVLGWAALSSWSDRCGYARAAEVSVYVHADHRGRGLGKALLIELIARGRAAGLGVLLARITTESEASLALHAQLGFQDIGTMRRVGEKFGRIVDVALLDLQLDGSLPPQ